MSSSPPAPSSRTPAAGPGAPSHNALGGAVHIDDGGAGRFCSAGAVAAPGRALSMYFADRERWNAVMGAAD